MQKSLADKKCPPRGVDKLFDFVWLSDAVMLDDIIHILISTAGQVDKH